jgi:acetylornithine deacetylase/succinyl-diaminopimelate desuccinylase-like protein
MQDVINYLKSHQDEAVEQLKELLSIASVSADSAFQPEMAKAAEFVRATLAEAGLDAEIVPTAGFPIVYGEWTKAEGAPTVLIYGHYDVQPPDPIDLWTTPPFEPDVRDGCIWARGATDDKGQCWTHVLSVAAWLKATGSLPVNVKFVIEGEEEVGSNNLDDYLETNKEKLSCDVAVISDTSQYAPGMPAITYGLRGILACEVTLTGPNRDLHSGTFGGSVLNPVNALARLVSKLHDENGRIQVPGFYDQVVELSDEERAEFAELPFNESDYLADLGIAAAFGEEGFSTLERRWARPTCDVNGMFGGYTGEGPKTIVPSKATAKITCRLVPDQDPHALTESLRQFLEANLPAGVTMEFSTAHGGQPSMADPTSPYIAAAKNAIQSAFGIAPVLIREGGSIPVVASLAQLLGVDTLLLGWGQNSDNLHSPNEHFALDGYHNGALASAYLWNEIANCQV